MATYVLVHGGGHGGWCYQPVARRLQAAGHVVYAPSLSGLGDRAHLLSPDVDLDTHVTDIVELLRFEDLHDVIVVGHSYGGMVITGVGDRAAERVGKLVYLDAANPRDGESLVDVAGPVITSVRPMGETRDDIELVLLPAPGAAAFYGITDPADLAWADERLTPHPWACFEQPLVLQHPDELAAIPSYHIICTSTLPTRRRSLMDEARAHDRLWMVDTGHDLMITEPDVVAQALLEVVDR